LEILVLMADPAGSSAPLPTHPVRIHGSWYDASRFTHPGGPVALQLGVGRDATVLFHAHHPLTDARRLQQLLAGMRVADAAAQAALDRAYPDALVPLPEGYDFDLRAAAQRLGLGPGGAAPSPVDPFEADVKALVADYLAGEARRRGISPREAAKQPPERWALFWLLGALALLGGVLPLYLGWPPAVLLGPTLLWVWQVNFFHDAAHFSISSDWRVNALLSYLAPWFSSPLEWYHQHVIGHHIYTNVPERDPDLYHSRLLWRFQRASKWLPAHAVMEWTTPLIWAVAVPSLALVRPLTTRLSMSYNDCVRLWAVSPARLALHLLGRAATAAFVWGWPFAAFAGRGYPLSTMLLFSLAPYPVFSLWFMLCSQINHHSVETSEARNANWYRHQVLTSQDVAPQSFLAFIVTGGLNLQIEHHLFPAVNHWHLRALQPKVRGGWRPRVRVRARASLPLPLPLPLLSHVHSRRPSRGPQVQALCKKHGVHYPISVSFAEAVGKIWAHMHELADPDASAKGGVKQLDAYLFGQKIKAVAE
jgi:delta11-fatty-acid desaturase